MEYLALLKKMGKLPIFDQNHGLTPFEKSQFFDSLNLSFFPISCRKPLNASEGKKFL